MQVLLVFQLAKNCFLVAKAWMENFRWGSPVIGLSPAN